MNNKMKIAIVASAVMMMFFSCKPTLPENVFPEPKKDEKTGKWGYVYQEKKIIKYQYDDAYDFSSGLACVKLNGYWGYVDKTGNKIIPFQYVFAESFNEDLAKVGSESGLGFIDKTGMEIIPLKYETIEAFTDGLAKVGLNGNYGYIDKTGNEIIPLIYEEAGNFKDDWLKVKLNGKYGYVDKSGTMVVPFIYDSSVDLSLVKAILFQGGSCEYYPERESSWIPGENTYILSLKFTLERNARGSAIADVYNKGRVVAPDGKLYEAGTVLSKDNVYDLWFGIPSRVDREKLIFVYNNQVLLLKKQ